MSEPGRCGDNARPRGVLRGAWLWSSSTGATGRARALGVLLRARGLRRCIQRRSRRNARQVFDTSLMGMLTTPQGRLCRASVATGRPKERSAWTESILYERSTAERSPWRPSPASWACRATRVYKYARMEDLSPEPPKARKRIPRRWTGGRRSWTSGSSGRTGSRAHGAPGLAPARRRVRRRRLRADRQALREGGEASPRGRPGLLPRPRLARGGRAGRLRPRGVRREGHEARDALLRRELPLLQRGARPGVPRRERGVRVPGPQERLRVRRRRPHQGRLRQRDRGRPPRVRQGPHHQALRGLQRPLRVRVPVLQPLLRTREGVRGEQGRDAEEEPLRPGPAGVGRRRVQRETAGEVARHVAQGALQEGAA